ncbi:MFS transporter [Natronocalculus amylovorans]|uniref:MFS transporter n=2 Tax=Natronocalculus amylovorans TaxID=2917812 RepID=A0AAE3FXL8_9EURY|nr:MFS transporter [Natronocalculus amylovorans]
MVGAIGNSFLIVVLPLFIVSDAVDIGTLLNTSVTVGNTTVTMTEPILIGVVLSLFGFLNSFSQPFTGRWSDRRAQRKPFILFGIALLGTGSLGFAFASDYISIVLLRAMQGLGAAFIVPATVALVNEYAASASDRGGNFGVYNTFRLIGFGFGPILAGIIIELGPYAIPGTDFVLSGFNAAFVGAFVGAFTSFILVYIFVNDADDVEEPASDDISIRIRGEDRLLDPVFTLGLATISMGICIALFATLQNEINELLNQGPVLFAAQFGAVTIANVLLQVPIGRACDRYGRRPFLVVGFIILIPATLLQGIVTSSGVMVLVRLAQGVAVALVFAPSLALAGDLAKAGQSGSTLSILTMGFGLGIAIGPLASGFLVTFGLIAPFAVGAFLALLGFIAVYTQVEETLDVEAAKERRATATQD